MLKKNYYKIIIIVILIILLNLIFPYFFSGIIIPFVNTKKKKSTEVVIAHYKEDLSWVDKYIPKEFKVYIYTKSDQKPNCKREYVHKYLDNVGRCDHTYLYHIHSKYGDNNLAENIIFLPGGCDMFLPFPKKLYLLFTLLNNGVFDFYCPNLNYHFYPEVTDYLMEDLVRNGYCSSHQKNRHKDCTINKFKFDNIQEWLDYFDLKKIKYISFTGIFSIKSKIIYRRSKSFYEKMIKHMDYADSTLNGHFLERSWYTIFNPN